MATATLDAAILGDRLVAFVDVLGWSQAVRSAGANGGRLVWFAELLQKIEDQAAGGRAMSSSFPEDMPLPEMTRDFQATQFSDCLVLSVPSDEPYAVSTMEQYLSYVCLLAAQNGFLLRGGLATGPLYHKERLVFGSAMLDAYEIERCVAVYPRIVPSEALLGSVASSSAWIEDADGKYYFDYLRAFGSVPSLYKKVICEGLVNGPNERVIQKYIWARDYFDSVQQWKSARDTAPIVLEISGQLWAYGRGQWPRPGSASTNRSG